MSLCCWHTHCIDVDENQTKSRPEVIKLEFILRLKIKCKQPIIALYFESETILKFYNLKLDP